MRKLNVLWFCRDCAIFGSTQYTDAVPLGTALDNIVIDHNARQPKCNTPPRKLRFTIEEEA